MNKIDQITIEELDIIAEVPHHVPICAHHEWNLDGLVEMMWRYMSLLRTAAKVSSSDLSLSGDFLVGHIHYASVCMHIFAGAAISI